LERRWQWCKLTFCCCALSRLASPDLDLTLFESVSPAFFAPMSVVALVRAVVCLVDEGGMVEGRGLTEDVVFADVTEAGGEVTLGFAVAACTREAVVGPEVSEVKGVGLVLPKRGFSDKLDAKVLDVPVGGFEAAGFEDCRRPAAVAAGGIVRAFAPAGVVLVTDGVTRGALELIELESV
jgi:hypothetical protein